jgi:hypothetical protein|tara:strand:- start:2334 stop:2525 length:192 start_codon:yes stop_codon:yes gene_type:complete
MEILDEILNKYKQEVQSLKDSVASGNIDTLAGYKQAVGRIQGVEWSMDTLKTIIQRMYHNEEE